MTVLDLRETPPLTAELMDQLHAEIDRREKEHGQRSAGMTVLNHADNCPRSAAFYFIFGGGPPSHAMSRGTLAHLFAEEAANYLLAESEPRMPPEVAKDRMQALIAEHPEMVLPEREQEALRIFAWNWALASFVHPETIVAIETMFSLELGGWLVRGKVDRAEILPSREGMIRDYKSGLNLPAREDYENDFQSKTYALLFMEGTTDAGPLGTGIPAVWTRMELPRLDPDETTGELRHREALRTRPEMFDFKLALERLLGVLDHGIETGDFPAVPGSHCARCPAAAHCPIPAEFRVDEYDQPVPTIENEAEASELAVERKFLADRVATLQRALREHASETGSPIYFGTDLAMDFAFQESKSIKDMEELEAAVARAVEYGEPFNLADHIKRSSSTPLRKRKVKPEERVA